MGYEEIFTTILTVHTIRHFKNHVYLSLSQMQTYMGLKLYCFLCIFLLTFVYVSLEDKLSIQYALH